MGRMKKNMAEYRKEMAVLEAKANRRLTASPPSGESRPAKKETESLSDLKKRLPPWLQKALPTIMTALMTLLMLMFYLFSMINKR
jgi:hypothetical protein